MSQVSQDPALPADAGEPKGNYLPRGRRLTDPTQPELRADPRSAALFFEEPGVRRICVPTGLIRFLLPRSNCFP